MDMTISRSFRLKSGYEMPSLGLGTWKLKGRECEKIVAEAVELGYDHIDTAEAYGNEQEIGKAIKNYDRQKLFITSKVAPEHLNKENILKSCARSLKKLGTDYLDMYLAHWPNDDIPVKQTCQAMQQLVDIGMVRSVGLSNYDMPRIKEVLAVSTVPICNLQIEYHPYTNRNYLPKFCEQEQIVITAYSPLARGKVLKDKTINQLAEKYGKTPGQITLKWLLQNGNIVIPKASSIEHLKENCQLFDWMMERSDLEKIDNIEKEQRLIDDKYT